MVSDIDKRHLDDEIKFLRNELSYLKKEMGFDEKLEDYYSSEQFKSDRIRVREIDEDIKKGKKNTYSHKEFVNKFSKWRK